MKRQLPRPTRFTGRLAAAAAVAVGALAFASWRGWTAMSENRLMVEAQSALDTRDFVTAQRLLQQLLRSHARNAEALTLAAQAARRAGDLRQAESWLDQAERAGAIAEVVALERALTQVQTGRNPAVAHYLSVAEAHPRDPASQLLLEAIIEGALVRLDLPTARHAVTIWDKSAGKKEQRAASLAWQGELAARRGDIAAAATAYRQAVAETPSSTSRRRRLADLMSRYDPAEALLQLDSIAAERLPTAPVTLLIRARCQRALGDFDAAEAALQQLLASQPDDYDALVEQGQLSLESRRYDTAESSLRAAIRHRPAGREALQALERCLRLNSKHTEATAIAEQLTRLDQQLDERLRQLRETGQVSP
jgi:tetratricopeptide (TPR) repeat protein